MRQTYLVEGWLGTESVGFARRKSAGAAITAADSLVLDKGADRIYIRGEGPTFGMFADYSPPGYWRRVDEPNLRAVLIERGYLDGDLSD